MPNRVRYEFDSAKDGSNRDKHGLSLADAKGFDWAGAIIREYRRRPYAEQRFEAIGHIGDRLHVIVYCHRGAAIRVISLRKANSREVKRHAKT